MKRKMCIITTLCTMTLCFSACGEDSGKENNPSGSIVESTFESASETKASIQEVSSEAVEETSQVEETSETEEPTEVLNANSFQEASQSWKEKEIKKYADSMRSEEYSCFFTVSYEERSVDIDKDGIDEYMAVINLYADMASYYDSSVYFRFEDGEIVEYTPDKFFFFEGYKTENDIYYTSYTYRGGEETILFTYDEKEGFVRLCSFTQDFDYDDDGNEITINHFVDEQFQYTELTDEEYTAYMDQYLSGTKEAFCSYEVVTTETFEYEVE